MSSDQLDWIKPGAKAVILTPDRWGPGRVQDVTVERVLKRDVVLSNGVRFKLTSAHGDALVNRRDRWSPNDQLVRVDAPEVTKTRRKIAHSDLKHQCRAAYDEWRQDEDVLLPVLAAFQALANFEATP